MSRKVFLATALIAIFAAEAHARPRRSNTQSVQSVPSYSYTSSHVGMSDQERCQAEADHMAANNIMGHVWGTIGRFEGVGYGSSPNCNTCTPGSGMTPTGDASAMGRNGMWYRVRSWR